MTTPAVKPPAEVRAPGKMSDFSGSESEPFTTSLLRGIVNTDWRSDPADADARDKQIHIAFVMLKAFAPGDPIEAMIAAQCIGLHHASMECLRRAMIPEQSFEVSTRLRKDAANLSRAMTDMVAALNQKRGKGPQVVRVERVVVHEGGQAIVGQVQTRGGGA